MALIRLDKYLSDCGIGTRSEVKNYIKKGRVKVNGTVAKDSSDKCDTDKDEVLFDGVNICHEDKVYFMLNKPAGCVSATRDKLSSTVLELLAGEPLKDAFPVGRLDKDTEGLLLITNDGQLAHNLLSPKKHVDKIYYATVDKLLTEQQMNIFRTGVDIGDDKLCLPAEIEYLYDVNNDEAFVNTYKVTLHEGRYHQVKRMFEAFGSTVVFLKRMSMGSLVLDENLEPGMYRRLTEKEIELLMNR